MKEEKKQLVIMEVVTTSEAGASPDLWRVRIAREDGSNCYATIPKEFVIDKKRLRYGGPKKGEKFLGRNGEELLGWIRTPLNKLSCERLILDPIPKSLRYKVGDPVANIRGGGHGRIIEICTDSFLARYLIEWECLGDNYYSGWRTQGEFTLAPETTRYKVGDRVARLPSGEKGTVIKVDPEEVSLPYLIEWEGFNYGTSWHGLEGITAACGEPSKDKLKKWEYESSSIDHNRGRYNRIPEKAEYGIEEWKKERPKPGDYRYQNRKTGEFLTTYFEMDLETWLGRMPER